MLALIGHCCPPASPDKFVGVYWVLMYCGFLFFYITIFHGSILMDNNKN